MHPKRWAIGTLVGGATLSATGYLVFGVLLPDFYSTFMNAGSAIGVARQPMLWWAIGVGMLSYGLLITLAVEIRPGARTVRGGLETGAIVGFLAWFTADFILYGIANVGNVGGLLIDPVLEAVPAALAGGAVAAVMANVRERRSADRRAA